MTNFLFSKPTAITKLRVKVEGSHQRSNNSSARKHCEKTNQKLECRGNTEEEGIRFFKSKSRVDDKKEFIVK